MPNWIPEGDTGKPQDNRLRSLHKWNSILFDTFGDATTPFPEGAKPLPSDNRQRALIKINAIKKAY